MSTIGTSGRAIRAAILLAAGLALLSGCSTIRERRGYLIDSLTYNTVRPGIVKKRSVEATLGSPTFVSQFGDPVWYYVSSTTAQKPFSRPRISEEAVLAVHFDAAGNVSEVDKSGLDEVVYLSPDSDMTPTLGRERGFLEDLFGNIGAVGAAAPPGGG